MKIKEIHQVAPQVVPFLVGALGTISRNISASLDVLEIYDTIRRVPVAALLGTAHVLRRVQCIGTMTIITRPKHLRVQEDIKLNNKNKNQ